MRVVRAWLGLALVSFLLSCGGGGGSGGPSGGGLGSTGYEPRVVMYSGYSESNGPKLQPVCYTMSRSGVEVWSFGPKTGEGLASAVAQSRVRFPDGREYFVEFMTSTASTDWRPTFIREASSARWIEFTWRPDGDADLVLWDGPNLIGEARLGRVGDSWSLYMQIHANIGVEGGESRDGWQLASTSSPWAATPRQDLPPLYADQLEGGTEPLVAGTWHDGALWMVGGSQSFLPVTGPSERHSRVVKSGDHGVSWTTVLENGPWGLAYRATHGGAWATLERHALVSFNGRLWVLGGEVRLFSVGGADWTRVRVNDVWSSSDGIAWSKEVAPPWAAREGLRAVVWNGRIWVIGGQGAGYQYSDIWSTDDGRTWRLEVASAPFGGRIFHSVFEHAGLLYVVGGNDGVTGARKDAWSSADGRAWTQVTAVVPPLDIPNDTSGSLGYRAGVRFASFAGKIHAMGGLDNRAAGTHHQYTSAHWTSEDGASWQLLSPISPWTARTAASLVVGDGVVFLLGGLSRRYVQDTWAYYPTPFLQTTEPVLFSADSAQSGGGSDFDPIRPGDEVSRPSGAAAPYRPPAPYSERAKGGFEAVTLQGQWAAANATQMLGSLALIGAGAAVFFSGGSLHPVVAGAATMFAGGLGAWEAVLAQAFQVRDTPEGSIEVKDLEK